MRQGVKSIHEEYRGRVVVREKWDVKVVLLLSIVGSYMVAWYRICFPLLFSALIIIIIIIIIIVVVVVAAAAAAAVVTFHCFLNKALAVASCILRYQRGKSATLRYVPDFAA